MSTQNASQTQKDAQQDSRQASRPDFMPGSKLDPMAFMLSGPASLLDTWAQMARDSIERVQSFYDELADVEDSAYSRAKKSARDLGDMMNDSLTYMADLSREWRKLSLEATRRSADLFGLRG